MSILTQATQPVNTRYWSGSSVVQFADETYATCDRGLLTIRQGQQTGQDDDYAGRVLGSVELDKAIAALKALMRSEEDAEFAAMLERWEAKQDARHDAVSAHYLHD